MEGVVDTLFPRYDETLQEGEIIIAECVAQEELLDVNVLMPRNHVVVVDQAQQKNLDDLHDRRHLSAVQ
jgi:hypothetical protein